MELSLIKLKLPKRRYSQTKGTSEIMNLMVENYFLCYVSYHQNVWDDLLSSEEFSNNSSVS